MAIGLRRTQFKLRYQYREYHFPPAQLAPSALDQPTTLFVTHYNFLRPHLALGYRVPVALPELSSITTLQGRWNKILALAPAA